jgi:hypothetical protein
MRKRHVANGRARLARAAAVSLALLLGALAPGAAFAWSVPGGGGDPVATPASGGPWLGESPPSTPMQSVGDRLGTQIQGFSEIEGFDQSFAMGHEMLHWTQMATLLAVPVALLASHKKKGGSSAANFFGKVHPPLHDSAPAPVPEPRSMALFALSGGIFLAAWARRQTRKVPVR